MPYKDRIDVINKLYDDGHEIHYWTARGATRGIDWTDLTREQLEEWGLQVSPTAHGQTKL